jgi:hypothetical protein
MEEEENIMESVYGETIQHAVLVVIVLATRTVGESSLVDG